MKKLILLTPLLITLAGCSVQSVVELPIFQKQYWLETNKGNVNNASQQNIRHDWWKSFDDKVLEQLIEKAKTHSPDVKIALARIKQARANEDETIASQLPIFSGSADVARNKYSKNVTNRPNARGYGTTIGAGFDAIWEVNYFGLDPALNAASAYTAISEANYDQALVTLFGDVARNYFEIRKLQIIRKVISDNISAQKDIVGLNESLQKAGKVSQAEIADSQTLLASTEATLLPLENELAERTYALELLLGEQPGAIKQLINQPVFINGYNKKYALATPASVLAERPDIRAAGEEVKYRSALKDLAFADYYPKISVSAFLGLESSRISNLVQGGSIAGNLAAGITAPIFDFGRIKARVKSADAGTEEALANYEKTVLTAFSEVESAVNAIETNRKYFMALQKAYKSASLSVDYATERYKVGLSPYLNVLEAQKNLNETSQVMAESNANIIINHVRLYKALGGGWKDVEAQTEPVKQTKALIAPTVKTAPPEKDLEIKLQENIDGNLD